MFCAEVSHRYRTHAVGRLVLRCVCAGLVDRRGCAPHTVFCPMDKSYAEFAVPIPSVVTSGSHSVVFHLPWRRDTTDPTVWTVRRKPRSLVDGFVYCLCRPGNRTKYPAAVVVTLAQQKLLGLNYPMIAVSATSFSISRHDWQNKIPSIDRRCGAR